MSEDEDGEQNCYYDQIPDSNKIQQLMNINMSNLVNQILNNALSSHSSIKFDERLYNCSLEEFNIALSSVKDKMSLMGLEG
jgi:hypothetical protein